MNAFRTLFGSLLVCSLVLITGWGTAASAQTAEIGTVRINVVSCPGVASAGVISEVPSDCVAADSAFTFYLIGDGTADYQQMITHGGVGTIDLAPGEYEVVEESLQVHIPVSVSANGTTEITFAFGNSNPAPAAGVHYNIFQCEGVTAPYFDYSSPAAAIAPGCTQVPGKLLITGTSAGATEYVEVDVVLNGENMVHLNPGTYTVVDSETGISTSITVSDSSSQQVLLISPLEVAAPTTGTAQIGNFVCPDATEASFVGTTGYMPSTCVPVAEQFTFYLVGDGTDDYQHVLSAVEGEDPAALELAPGEYVVVHEPSQVKMNVSITAGGTTYVTFVQPQAAAQPTAVPTQPNAQPTAAPVTSLPKTGIGTDDTNMFMLMAAGAGTLLAAGAVQRIRRAS